VRSLAETATATDEHAEGNEDKESKAKPGEEKAGTDRAKSEEKEAKEKPAEYDEHGNAIVRDFDPRQFIGPDAEKHVIASHDGTRFLAQLPMDLDPTASLYLVDTVANEGQGTVVRVANPDLLLLEHAHEWWFVPAQLVTQQRLRGT